MRTLNEVRLLGHLGRDAETRYTGGGTPVTNFSLATERRFKQGDEWKSEPEWHDIVLWGGENVAGHLTKGKAVLVCGRLQTRSWEDQSGQRKYRTEVVCDSGGIILCGGGAGGRDGPSAPDRGSGGRGAGHKGQQVTDDDVPF